MKWDRWILKIDGFLKDGLLEIDVYSFYRMKGKRRKGKGEEEWKGRGEQKRGV